MAGLLLAGGLAGSVVGVLLFAQLKKLGQLDLVISLSYVGFLGTVGVLMLAESLISAFGARSGAAHRRRHFPWHAWPLRMRFPRSHLYISVIPPLAVGLIGGGLSAIMGVGGGFVMVPMMIYLLGMPTAVVFGTSLLQIIAVTASVTLLQAVTTQTVDAVLAMILLAGGAVGAQIGARIGAHLKGAQVRVLLALLVLAVCARMTWDLVAVPADPFTVADQ
jgi:uncharacterized membrane protein YfcA